MGQPSAAHAAAITFDLLTMLGLFFLGRRIRVPTGVVLAYLWAAYPFTLFALSSNSNDSLVACCSWPAAGDHARRRCEGSRGARRPDQVRAARARAAVAARAGLAAQAPRCCTSSSTRSRPSRSSRSCSTTTWRRSGTTRSTTRPTARPVLDLGPVGRPASSSTSSGSRGGARAAGGVPARGNGRRPGRGARRAVIIALQLGISYWFYLYILGSSRS